MKNYRLLFLTVLIVFSLLTGCKKNEKQSGIQPNPTPDIKVIAPTTPDKTQDDSDNIIEIKDDKGETALKVTVGQPDLKEYVSKDAMENISAYYDKMYTKKRTYWQQELAETALAQKAEAEKNNGIFTPFTIDESYEITGNTDSYLSVKRTSDEFTGGVHGSEVWDSETFLKSNGAFLLLGDMFTVDESVYKARLMDDIRIKIDNMKETGSVELFENAAELAKQTFDPTDFYLTSDSIVIFYPTYAIGPFSEGNQMFEIKFKQLSDIIKSEYLK